MSVTPDRALFHEDYPDYYEICGQCGVQACMHGSTALPGSEKSRIGRDVDSSKHKFVRSFTVAYTDSILARRNSNEII